MQRFDLGKQFCGIFGGLAALGDTGRSGETGIQSRQQTLDFGSLGEQFGEFFGGGHVILLGNGAFPGYRRIYGQHSDIISISKIFLEHEKTGARH